MSGKYAQHTLESFVAAIRELEQQAAAARKDRDRMLGKAREAAELAAKHMVQAANLREILTGLDREFAVKHLGELFDERREPTRAERIAHFRDALAWLEAVPDVPFDDSHLSIGVEPEDRSPEGKLAALHEVAAAMGVEATNYTYGERTTWVARREFGSVACYASVSVLVQPAAPAEAPQSAEAAESPVDAGVVTAS